MKKRLEAELISIAHRVLKLKSKSEIDQLYLETRKLYETLAVLKFYGDNYEQIKSDISKEDLEEKLTATEEETTSAEMEVKPEKIVPITEEIVIGSMPEIAVIDETDSETEVNEIEEEEKVIEENEIEEEKEDFQLSLEDLKLKLQLLNLKK